MPRPSLKNKRTEMILIAIRHCVAVYGVEGATQDRIAEAAGMKRPMLRHYLGNRESMINAFIDYMADEFDAESDWLSAALPDEDRLGALLGILFGPVGESSVETLLATQAIIAAADRYPHARSVLLHAIQKFVDLISQELSNVYPHADTDQCDIIAHAIAGLHFNIDGLSPLKPPPEWRENAKRASESLIQSLEGR